MRELSRAPRLTPHYPTRLPPLRITHYSPPVQSFRVELDPDQAKRLHMRLKDPVSFTVSPDGGYLADVQAQVVFDKGEDA